MERWAIGLRVAAVCALVGLAATACSSSGDSSPNGRSSSPQATRTQDAVAANSADLLQRAFAGTFTTPPASGPSSQPHKTVWVISCGQLSTSCNVPTNALMTAGHAIGWSMHVFDGKLNPASFAAGVGQAVSAGADGIALVGIDCALARVPLQHAKTAGIKVIGFLAFDCSDPAVGGPSLFATDILFHGGLTQAAYLQQWGATKAAWLIQQSHGTANVLDIVAPAFLVQQYANKGFLSQMATCTGCHVTELDLQATDIVSGSAGQKVESALAKNSSLTAINVGADPLFQQVVNQAVKASEKTGLLGMGGECFDANVAEIRTAGSAETACVAIPEVWMGWAAIDELNRAFAGSDPTDEGLGLQAVDGTHNLPATEGWRTPVDFESAYRRVWGV